MREFEYRVVYLTDLHGDRLGRYRQVTPERYAYREHYCGIGAPGRAEVQRYTESAVAHDWRPELSQLFVEISPARLYSWDPGREDMLEFLASELSEEAADDFDREEAMYWFAYEYHGGGGSNLYAALSCSPYRPGILADGPEPDSGAQLAYESLTAHWEELSYGQA